MTSWSTRAKQDPAFVITTALLCVVYFARWPFRAKHLYEWDSAQYALGVIEFDVYKHQPHPPGYPLWIAFLKGIHLVVGDLNLTQVLAAFFISSLAALIFFRFATEVFGRWLALFATACVVFSPPAMVASVHADTYPVDILASTSLAWLASRLWKGEKRFAPLAAALVALFAGTRQSGAVMMAPLVGIALLRACRFDWKAWAKTSAAAIVVFLAWYVPVVSMHHGVAQFQKFQSDNVRRYFSAMSIFYGAPTWAHRNMLIDIAHWTAMMVGVSAVVALLIHGVAVALAKSKAPPKPPVGLGAIFYALWLLPNTVYTCGFHCPKPGYLLLSLPALALLITGVVGRAVGRLEAQYSAPAGRLIPAITLMMVATSMWVGSVHYDDLAFDRASLASLRESDRAMDALQELASKTNAEQDDVLVVVMGGAFFGPNYRSIMMELDAEIWTFENELIRRTARHHVEHNWVSENLHEVPKRIRRILWVHHPHLALPRSLRASFPNTRQVRDGITNHVWETDIGDEGIDGRVTVNDFSLHFIREGHRTLPQCELGSGWTDVIFDTDSLWSVGAKSELHVALAAPGRVVLRFGLIAPADPIRFTRDGVVLDEWTPPKPGSTLVEHSFAFDGRAGENVVVIEHDIRSPDWTPFYDYRGLAGIYISIACTTEYGVQSLVP